MSPRKEFSEAEVAQKIAALPPDVKSLIYSAGMDAILGKIADAHHLHIDKISALSVLAGDVMLGLMEGEDFPSAIAEELEVGKPEAEAIAQDVNTQLFSKIRESLKKISAPSAPTVVSAPSAPSTLTAPTVPATPNVPATPPAVSPVLSVPPPAPQPSVVASPPATPPPPEAHPLDAALMRPTVSLPQAVESGAIPTAAPAAPASPAKTYAVDPYREPIE